MRENSSPRPFFFPLPFLRKRSLSGRVEGKPFFMGTLNELIPGTCNQKKTELGNSAWSSGNGSGWPLCSPSPFCDWGRHLVSESCDYFRAAFLRSFGRNPGGLIQCPNKTCPNWTCPNLCVVEAGLCGLKSEQALFSLSNRWVDVLCLLYPRNNDLKATLVIPMNNIS